VVNVVLAASQKSVALTEWISKASHAPVFGVNASSQL